MNNGQTRIEADHAHSTGRPQDAEKITPIRGRPKKIRTEVDLKNKTTHGSRLAQTTL
jgi:hypothetical protein